MSHRFTTMWKIRRFVGGMLQHLVWRLCDPHDDWMIDYRDKDGRAFGMVRSGFYSVACAAAKEVKGKIVGHKVGTVSADEWPDTTDGADWWKGSGEK